MANRWRVFECPLLISRVCSEDASNFYTGCVFKTTKDDIPAAAVEKPAGDDGAGTLQSAMGRGTAGTPRRNGKNRMTEGDRARRVG